jgi:hypothetical protein
LCFITYTFYENNNVDKRVLVYNIIPIGAYGLFYIVMSLTHVIDGIIPYEYDWYLFMKNGVVIGLITYVLFIIFSYVVIYVLNKVNGMLNSK